MEKSPQLTPDMIRAFREENRLSQQALAHILGVGLATVSRWERGTPPTGTAAVILRTAIFFPLGRLGTTDLSPSYAIYKLLKTVFESDDSTARTVYEAAL